MSVKHKPSRHSMIALLKGQRGNSYRHAWGLASTHESFSCRWVAWLFIAGALLLPPLVYGASSPPDSFIVHFERDGRFAAARPRVSHWLRSDVAVVRPTARRFTAEGATLEEEMAAWRRLPGVRLVEPDAVGKFDGLVDAGVPNDPLYAKQTWLDLVGARGLWALGMGTGVTVAVVDSGVDLHHPDLQANLIAGYDFADNNATPQDQVGHGTFVAGLLAAVANNGIGVAGLAPGVKIMPGNPCLRRWRKRSTMQLRTVPTSSTSA